VKPTILFIHGMFQNPRSWEAWVRLFEQRNFDCINPSWPLHKGEPAELREHPPAGLGTLGLEAVIERFVGACEGLPAKPALIGHSVGGLVAQILAARGLASAAVCISSVAPNALVAADWHLVKAVASIINPLKGHEPYEMTAADFRESFCNTLNPSEAAAAYAATATPDSRQVLRDCLGRAGHIDLVAPHVPLLFIAGSADHVIPAPLNRRNCEHYTDRSSVTDFVEFPHRGHFICNEPGWREVADTAGDWLTRHLAGDSAQRLATAR
jgi:pimeloyl-ACP methyl ester carboxylesterase